MTHLKAGHRLAVLALLLVSAVVSYARAAEQTDPELTLQTRTKTLTFKRSELMKRSDVETLALTGDPAYPARAMSYKAIRATALFEGLKIADDEVIEFRCLDGFSAPISKERLLNKLPGSSIAYVAIEEAGTPWPSLPSGKGTAGPYYVVWLRPEASFVGPEEWPYQLTGFDVKGTLESLYPQIFPDAKLKPTSPARQGFSVFTKNCFACHTVNKAGAAEVGPDLNVPMNPTEYLHKAAMRRLIRDPQSVRHYPRSRMSAFPTEVLSENDLDHLIAYLEHMAKRKVK